MLSLTVRALLCGVAAAALAGCTSARGAQTPQEAAPPRITLVDVKSARVSLRPITPVRRHVDLPPIQAAGLNAKELDEQIAARVSAAKIDDQIVRLLVWDVDRTVARDLDHATIREYKARALNFQLDLRRPDWQRGSATTAGTGVRRQTLTETVRDFLGRRPLDAELNRESFVKLGVEYLEAVAREESP